MILGFSRAGSRLFWKSSAEAPPPAPHEPAALAATFALLAGLVALTVLAGPVTDWLATTADALHDRAPYIAAFGLEART
jgi:multicomponent K+:H+ antiporter subunit D